MFTFKIVLAIGVVITCGYIGVLKAKRYEDREYILREAIMLFKGIENEMRYTLSVLPNAIESVRINMKTKLKDVLGSISYILLSTNVNEQEVYNEMSKLNELSAYDKQVIVSGILELGKTDIDGQIPIIQMTNSTLENLLENSIEEKKKNAKLFKTVGLATGLMLAIILI